MIVRESDGFLYVEGPTSATEWKGFRSLPGSRYIAAMSAWKLPATPATAVALDKRLNGDAVWSEDARALIDARQEAVETLDSVRRYEDADLEPLPWDDFKFPPWRHQLAAYHAAMASDALLLYLGMGAGKTRVTFDILRGRGCRRVLIVAPKSVVENWAAEGDKHKTRLEVKALDSGSVKQRTELARRVLDNPAGDGAVVVINYESVWREPFAKLVASTSWDAVVCDEIQRIKAPGGKSSRFLARLVRTPLRLGLSGTPCPQGPMDAYGIFRFLDPGVFGTNFTRFRARYAVMGGYQGRQVVGYQNEDEFNERFYSLAFRVDRDVLDLPDEQHLERTCSMPMEAVKIYRELRDELVTEIEGGLVTASNALARLLKLAQVASGTIKDEDRTVPVHTAKQELLAEMLEELPADEPVVVFCRFRGDLDQVHAVAEKLGRGSAELSGRRRDLATWQQGGAPILAVQIQAGGVGIDLTRACYAVYFSQTWSLGDYEQSLARVHRPGQDRAVTYVHLITRGTVDRTIYRALREKKDAIEAILANPAKELA